VREEHEEQAVYQAQLQLIEAQIAALRTSSLNSSYDSVVSGQSA